MKRILTISIFVLAYTIGFAQYNYVQYAPSGVKIQEGQYNVDPGLAPGDSKETIIQKMSAVQKIGNWKYWFENGQLAAEEHYTSTGQVTGVWTTYTSTGSVASTVNYATGTAVYYHANGAKAEEGNINTANERIGNWTGWHDNGTVNYTGSWSAQGLKTGVWQFYDNNSQVVGTEHWNNGILMQ